MFPRINVFDSHFPIAMIQFFWSDAFFSQQGDRFAKPGHGKSQIFNRCGEL